MTESYYSTEYGKMHLSSIEKFYESEEGQALKGKINLIFTSPPFPLKRKKSYGNFNGIDYLTWMKYVSTILSEFLTEDGSIVIEMGNAWECGQPTFSTLPIEALLEFKRSSNLYLCQEFIHHNPSRLPTPIEWVNKRRIRVKDSFTRIWWLSKCTNPKANNRKILVPYSKSMKKLLSTTNYNSGLRPSEHVIGSSSFNNDNGGAIPSNVLIASNTSAKDLYLDYCKSYNLPIHPARMAKEIPEFFIRFLTEKNDLVLDPFSGSNTTGFVAEQLGRNWVSIEENTSYFEGSKGRFSNIFMAE